MLNPWHATYGRRAAKLSVNSAYEWGESPLLITDHSPSVRGGGPPSSGMAVHDPTDPYGDGFTRISAPFHPNDLELWLDKWVVAKRTRDFPMADRLRDEMRKGGVDPAEHRPKVQG